MKVLVACEFSEVVKEQFLLRGHDAHSCDLLPGEKRLPNHHQCDVREILNDGWDLMIAHPPCTYLSRAGIRWLFSDQQRRMEVVKSAQFFNQLLNADIPMIAVENPIQHRFAREFIRKHDQVIEPFMFGHKEHKRTCLWLKNLPYLNPTEALWQKEPVLFVDKRGGKHYSTDMYPPSLERGQNRSRTFTGIAVAMASQWGSLGVRE